MRTERVKKVTVPSVVKSTIEHTTKWSVYKLHSDNRAWHRRRKFVLSNVGDNTTAEQRNTLVANIQVELDTHQLQYDSVGMVKLTSYRYSIYWAIIVNTRF